MTSSCKPLFLLLVAFCAILTVAIAAVVDHVGGRCQPLLTADLAVDACLRIGLVHATLFDEALDGNLDRVMVVEVMGRYAGWIAVGAGVGAGCAAGRASSRTMNGDSPARAATRAPSTLAARLASSARADSWLARTAVNSFSRALR